MVGAVGRLTYQKAPEDFLAALRALGRPGRDRRLGRRTGNWPGRSAAWPAAAGPPGGAGRQRATCRSCCPAFDVFALPSRYEGLPTAVVEAMVCGVPVVATAVNAVGDVVVPGETGLLVPPQRPELLAEAVGYLLDRPAARRGWRLPPGPGSATGSAQQALRDALTAAYATSRYRERSRAEDELERMRAERRVLESSPAYGLPKAGPPAPIQGSKGDWVRWSQRSIRSNLECLNIYHMSMIPGMTES